MFKIVDNYLSAEEHVNLKTYMESNAFPWYFAKCTAYKNNYIFDYQFIHVFYKDNLVNSNFFHYLDPLLNKIKPLSLVRIKANLNPISQTLLKFEEHKDKLFKCKVAIYYLNNNNGYLNIEGKKIDIKENRIVFFNSDKKHYGTNSTNCTNKMVINLNYF